MSDLTIQDLCRLSHMPDNPNNPAEQIAGQKYYDVEFTGGNISNVVLTDVTINGSTTARTETIITASGPYAVQPDDYVVTIEKTVPEVTTVNLPAIPTTSRSIIVKDGAGNAGDFNITLNGNGKNIDGVATTKLIADYSAIEIIFNGTEWNILNNYKIDGDVVGPGSSTDNAIVRFDGTTGTVIQNSGVIISDSNNITGAGNISATTFTGALIGNADTATLASNVVVADAVSDTTTFPMLAGSATGNLPVLTDPGLSYNALTNALLATGTVTGSALVSTVAIGTPPLTVTSTTQVPNLYVARAALADTATTNANLTGAVTSVGNATSLGSFTSAQLATALTDETGTGANVFATSPTLVTPNLGTPSTLVGTNITGTAASLTAGTVTTNANLTGAVTSTGNATSLGSFSSASLSGALTDETGTGSAVFATSPTLVTPLLGTPTSGTLTNCTGLPISTGVSGLGTGVATFLATPTSANLAAAVTNETGTGALVFATSPTMVTPVLGAASATSIAFTSTSGIIGTTTNDNAAAGSVGEYVSSTVLVGSQVSLTTNTPANVTSISLTAGDWDVEGLVIMNPAGTTTSSFQLAWTSQTSVTTPTLPNSGGMSQLTITFATGGVQGHAIPRQRFSLAGTTTIYLEAFATFGVSTMGAYGHINARRVR